MATRASGFAPVRGGLALVGCALALLPGCYDLDRLRAVDPTGDLSRAGDLAGPADLSSPSPIRLVQSAPLSRSVSAPTVALQFAATPSAGSFVLVRVLVWNNGTPPAPTVTDNNGNAYSLACTHAGGGSGGRVALYYASNVAIGVAPFVVSVATGGHESTVNASEYSGLDPSMPLDQSANAGGAATTMAKSGTTGTTSAADELVAAIVDLGNTFSSVAASGFNNQLLNSDMAYAIGSADDRIVASIGTFSATWSVDSANPYDACIATFR